MFLLSLPFTAFPLKNHMPKGGPQRVGTRISTLDIFREKENTGKRAKEETLVLNVVGLPSTSRSHKGLKNKRWVSNQGTGCFSGNGGASQGRGSSKLRLRQRKELSSYHTAETQSTAS